MHSVGTNGEHGLPRTNADKRHAVLLLLNDIATGCERGNHVCSGGSRCWESWSNHEIARRCSVSSPFVGEMRRSFRTRSSSSDISLETISSETAKTYTTKHGTEATMRTENIGRSDGMKRPAAPNYKPISEHVEGFRANRRGTSKK